MNIYTVYDRTQSLIISNATENKREYDLTVSHTCSTVSKLLDNLQHQSFDNFIFIPLPHCYLLLSTGRLIKAQALILPCVWIFYARAYGARNQNV